MTINEETRHRLYQRLEEVLGPEEASVLMEHLPPVGWADVATKRDLDALATQMSQRMDRSDLKLDAMASNFDLKLDAMAARLDGRLDRELRLMTWRLVMAMLAVMSVAMAVSRL